MEGGRIYGGTNHFARRKGGSAAVKTIWRYMKLRLGRIGLSVSVKLLASVLELLIPYILEHIIDRVVPGGRVGPVVGWGALMVVVALLVRQTNIFANMTAVSVSQIGRASGRERV